MIKNSYPELPELQYYRTSVEMGLVVSYLKSLNVSKAIKCAAYVMFRQESGNGRSGVNNNYLGIQADVARWPDSLNKYVNGTVLKKENMTGNYRRFLSFDSFEGSIEFLIDRIRSRGLYIGGYCNVIVKMQISNDNDWVTCYWRSWVTGDAKAIVPYSEQKGLLQMYAQGMKIF